MSLVHSLGGLWVIFTFTGEMAQSTLNACEEMLFGMQRGKPPNITSMKTDTFMGKIADLLPEMCVEIISEKGKEKKVSGKAAIKVRLQKAEMGETMQFICFQ